MSLGSFGAIVSTLPVTRRWGRFNLEIGRPFCVFVTKWHVTRKLLQNRVKFGLEGGRIFIYGYLWDWNLELRRIDRTYIVQGHFAFSWGTCLKIRCILKTAVHGINRLKFVTQLDVSRTWVEYLLLRNIQDHFDVCHLVHLSQTGWQRDYGSPKSENLTF